MIVPRLWPSERSLIRVRSSLSNGYFCGVRSWVIARSRPELSITPPTYLPPRFFEKTETRRAHDKRASLPIPLAPMKGRFDRVLFLPADLLEYPIFRNFF